MKRWSYTLLTVLLGMGALLIRHAPARGADAAPAVAQPAEQVDDEFVPSEELPADASISFPVDI